VFVSFDIMTFLFWLCVSGFVPGAILSFSILRKDDFSVLEKLLLGFTLGFVILPLIPFLLYLVVGIKFSYTIALLSVAAMYAIALAAFVLTKSYENLKPPTISELTDPAKLAIPLVLLAILVVSYLIRLSTYSPIYQELDPYYYTYVAQQILTSGFNPQNDQTAWYPDLVVNHRTMPMLGYMESIWYSLYTGGGEYDNMLLALVASMYPPIAAVLAIFFIYLLISSVTKREWGLAGAGLAAFVPVFIFKLFAGEQEIQPYAFFALAFFYAMYAISLRRKDLKFSAFAGLAYAALTLGSSSQILALVSVFIFVILQSILLFIRDEDGEGIKDLMIPTSIVFVIGVVASNMIVNIFTSGMPSFGMIVPFFLPIAFACLLYAVKLKLPDRQNSMMALGAILIISLLIYVFTPLGDYVKGVGERGFGITQYNSPLDRTIAEQGGAPSSFGGEMGFVAEPYGNVAATALLLITMFLKTSSPTLAASLDNAGAALVSTLFLPFSFVANGVLAVFVGMVNVFLRTDVMFTQKDNSFMLFWLVAFWASLIYCAWKFQKRQDDGLFVLFLAMVMPPLVVGLLKAKYTIYAAVMVAIAIGFTLGTAPRVVDEEWFKKISDEDTRQSILSGIMVFAGLLVFLQFTHNGFAPSLLFGSLQPLYQNDPAALAPKFTQMCKASADSDVCAAAAQPLAYASNGTNYQYSSKLCMLSIYSNYSYLANQGLAPSWEAQAAAIRCQRLSDYWVSSMEWIKQNTEPGARIVSWWDYGHWINFFGQRNAVVRNEHLSHDMIGDVADAYLDSTPEELKGWMQAHDIKYALFDIELVSSGNQLGGKYGALNYLSCAHHNETNVSRAPGESGCEAEHLWETVMVSQNPCTISELTNKTGFLAYKMHYSIFERDVDGTPKMENGRPIVTDMIYQPYYAGECMNPADDNLKYYCRTYVRADPVYCVGKTILANGQEVYAPYDLNQTYPNGDLKLDKAVFQFPIPLQQTSHFGPATEATLLYTNDNMWLENGEVVSGYGDRKGKFYDSALYQAIFLDDIPGFKEVYSNGAVKIFKIE